MGRNLGPLNIKDSYEGLVQISGSSRDTLTDGSGSVITSLDVSASFATTATSASHAIIADSALTATSASHALNADNAISSSYAVTASFALNAGASTLQEVLNNSNTATGVDIILTGSYQRASGSFSGNVIDNITDTYTGTEKINHVITLTQAEYNALSPAADTFYVITDAAATMITGSVTDATLAFLKDDGTTFPLTVNNVANATSASYAVTASFVENSTPNTLAEVLTAGNTTLGGQSIIISGSSLITRTLDGDGITSGIAGGEYTIKAGSVDARLVLQGNGSNDNIIKLDTTGVKISGSVDSQNNITAPLFIGDLQGNANTATSASHALNADNAISSSYAVTASYAENAGGAAFPYTGSAEISGSIDLNGYITTGFADNVISSPLASHAIIGGEANEVSGGSNGNVIINGFGATISGGGANTIVGANSAISSTSIYNGIYSNQAGNITAGSKNVRIGGTYGNISGGGSSNAAVGGDVNNITGNISHAAILGGSNNTVTHNRSVILGGSSLSTTKDNEVVVPSLVATELTASGLTYPSADGSNGDVLTTDGAGNLTLQPAAGGAAFPYTGSAEITGSLGVTGSVDIDNPTDGINNTASPGTGTANLAVCSTRITSFASNAQVAFIAGTDTATVGAGVNQGVILGAAESSINGTRNVVVGGYDNDIGSVNNAGIFNSNYSDITGGSLGQTLVGGSTNTISGGSKSIIVGGNSHTISTGDSNGILGGTSHTATHNNSVVIGGDSLSTSKVNEVVVPNLDINGTVVQSVQALTITSNTASLDASTGQMFTLGLQNATDTHLELSNQVAGQTFSLKITNNATSAGTITFDNQFEFEGGTAFTATAATNAVDILTFTTFDGSNVQCVGSKNFS